MKPGDGPVKALKSLGDLILCSGDLNPTPKDRQSVNTNYQSIPRNFKFLFLVVFTMTFSFCFDPLVLAEFKGLSANMY
jgi:hypothetical protein